MKHPLERQENLDADSRRRSWSCDVENGASLRASSPQRARCIMSRRPSSSATGTYLDRPRLSPGDCIQSQRAGRDARRACRSTERLRALGLPLRRFKTGTPPRVNARSVDFSKMERQDGDAEPLPFSVHDRSTLPAIRRCATSPTRTRRHTDIIRANLDRSPIYSGVIDGRRAALLPEHRDEDRPLRGQAPPPALHRTDGA